MALGFFADYNGHVAYHFVSSKATSTEHRVIDALGKFGVVCFCVWIQENFLRRNNSPKRFCG
jgi:hypothetical protein